MRPTVRMLQHFSVAGAIIALASTCAPARAGEHGEIGVGRTADNRLTPDLHFAQPVVLPRSIFPSAPGFTTSLLGFESVIIDDPAEDVFVLAPESDVSAELTALAGPLRIFNGLPLLSVGQAMHFGPPVFDYHPLFNLPPGTVPGTVASASFILRDGAGISTDSQVFTISFTPACPGDFNLSGAVSVQDIFDYLAAYFEPCP